MVQGQPEEELEFAVTLLLGTVENSTSSISLAKLNNEAPYSLKLQGHSIFEHCIMLCGRAVSRALVSGGSRDATSIKAPFQLSQMRGTPLLRNPKFFGQIGSTMF